MLYFFLIPHPLLWDPWGTCASGAGFGAGPGGAGFGPYPESRRKARARPGERQGNYAETAKLSSTSTS